MLFVGKTELQACHITSRPTDKNVIAF